MATSLEKLNQATARLSENEERVNIFTNDPKGTGYYSTNINPPGQVETLPHLMQRLNNRYLTVVFKGAWKPDTAYSQNDIVQGPTGEFWLATAPFTSSDSIETDIANKNLIPYGAALAAAENNLRWPWTATQSIAAGEILTLPQPYQPSRDSLLLFYQGAACSPKKAGIEASGLYQYEEIGTDPNELSTQVRVWFDISAGDVLDMFVASSSFTETIERTENAALKAEAARDEAVEAATKAKQSEAVVVGAVDEVVSAINAAKSDINTAVETAQASIDESVDEAQTAIGTTVDEATTKINALIDTAQTASLAASKSAEAAQLSADTAEEILVEIKAIQGAATYLPAYDFGDPASHANWQQLLTGYALPFFTGRTTVPNSTFVQNLWNNHEWVYNIELDIWTDNGLTAVSTATNETLGVVKGTESTYGAVRVMFDGSMSVNGFNSKVDKATTIIAEAPLKGGGSLNENITFGLNSATSATATADGKAGYVIYGADDVDDERRDVALTPKTFSVKTITIREITKQAETLVTDSDFNVPAYIIGSNKLKVWYNGARCYPGLDAEIHQYIEVGTANSMSTTIKFNFDLSPDDVIMVEVK